MDAARFVQPGQALLVVGAIDGDVFFVPFFQRLAGRFDHLQAALAARRVGAEIRMGAGAVPIALDGFGVQRRVDAAVFGDPIQQPAGDPQVIRDVGRAQRSDLEFPLAGHDLGVDAGNGESGFHAGVHVRLDDFPAEDLVRAHPAVERPLRRGIAALRPAQGRASAEERVFLLDAEPRLLGFELLLDFDQARAGIGLVDRSVRQQDFVHDQDVVAFADRVGYVAHRFEQAVAVVSVGLHGTGPVEAPHGDVVQTLDRPVDDLRLRAQRRGRRVAVHPDVFGFEFSHDESSFSAGRKIYRRPSSATRAEGTGGFRLNVVPTIPDETMKVNASSTL